MNEIDRMLERVWMGIVSEHEQAARFARDWKPWFFVEQYRFPRSRKRRIRRKWEKDERNWRAKN